jgi:RNA polymerase sigma factor (sigma-70 family)
VIVPVAEEENRVQDLVANPMSGGPDNSGISDAVNDRTDEQLMVAFARGQTDAFNVLFARYKQPLFGFFRRRLADPAQAEELTQETLLAVLRGTAHYEATALFRTWLYAIGFKILRAHRRKTAFRAMFVGTAPPAFEPASHPHLDQDLLLREAVRKLDRIDREVLLLREFEQLTYV